MSQTLPKVLHKHLFLSSLYLWRDVALFSFIKENMAWKHQIITWSKLQPGAREEVLCLLTPRNEIRAGWFWAEPLPLSHVSTHLSHDSTLLVPHTPTNTGHRVSWLPHVQTMDVEQLWCSLRMKRSPHHRSGAGRLERGEEIVIPQPPREG